MRLLFELSKEHRTLPSAEVCAVLEAEEQRYTIVDSNEDVLVIELTPDAALIPRLARRLAYTFMLDELLFSCPATLDDMIRCAKQHPLRNRGSIAIRCKNRSPILQSDDVIDKLGDVYTKNRAVNLVHPDIELRAVVREDTAYVGIKKASLDTSHFHQRRGHLRPFLLPITLHPKIARCLVNLSSVKTHETLLDPFCGTGGILLEANLLGIRVIGSDIEQKMIDGCQKNLEFYHVKNFSLFRADIGDISKYISQVDAVVTDFPYARATTTKGEQLRMLYERAFQSISQILKEKGKAVIGLSNDDVLTLGEQYLSLVESYPMKSHRSLTRHFVVFKKL
jgi:tRNA (guanine10-N2)-dimethyltransferase